VTTVSEWDPRDPEASNVYYDMSGWSADQQADLIEALAEAGIPHGWEGAELVVPDDVEAETDALFEVLEARLGIQPGGDGPVAGAPQFADDESLTDYELDDWSIADRAVLTEALVASRVPHRWEGDTLVVPTAAEDSIEELMTDIESGQVWIVPEGDDDDLDNDDVDPAAVLLDFREAGERLARDPLDAEGLDALRRALDDADPSRPMSGVAQTSWRQVCALAEELADALAAGEVPDEPLAVDAAERLHAVAANLLT
jgi:hypothetical protein